jgi:hypothetical protein
MQYDQFDPITMTPTELKIQFASMRVDLKHTENERQRISQELSDLKSRSEKISWKRMALGGGMSLLIAANSILVNVGTGLVFATPPNSLGYLALGFAAFVYVVGIFVSTFIVGGRMNE